MVGWSKMSRTVSFNRVAGRALQLNADDGIAAQLEKIVVNADLFDAQNMRPHLA